MIIIVVYDQENFLEILANKPPTIGPTVRLQGIKMYQPKKEFVGSDKAMQMNNHTIVETIIYLFFGCQVFKPVSSNKSNIIAGGKVKIAATLDRIIQALSVSVKPDQKVKPLQII